MNFLHTTIRHSQKILHIVPVNKEDKLILIFSNLIQFVEISRNEDKISFKIIESYPISVNIVSALNTGFSIVFITENCELIITGINSPFASTFKQTMIQTNSPLKIPLAHIVGSQNHETICAFSYSGYVTHINMISDFSASLKNITMPEGLLVISATGTSEYDIYYMLVRAPNTKFYILKLLTNTETIDRNKFEVPNNSRKIICVHDHEKLVLFTDDALFIYGIDKENDVERHPLDEPMCAHFLYSIDEKCDLIFQTYPSGNIYLYDFNINECIKKGKFPIMSLFCLYNNDDIFCVAEHGKSYILSVSELTCSVNENDSFLKAREIDYASLLTSAVFSGDSMYIATGYMNSSQITRISNYVPNTNTRIEYDVNDFKNSGGEEYVSQSSCINDKLRLFTTNESTLISNSDATFILFGNTNLVKGPTIKTGLFDGLEVQVHVHGIHIISKPDDDSLTQKVQLKVDEIITLCSICDSIIILSTNQSRVVLIAKDEDPIDTMIQGVTAFEFCDELIAIATSNERISDLTLYHLDLNKTDYNPRKLTSAVTSLVYLDASKELFVATRNGSIFKLSIESQAFSSNMEFIYNNTRTVPYVFPYMDNYCLIVSDKMFLFSNEELLQIGSCKDFVSFTVKVGEKKDSVVYLTKDLDLFELDINGYSDLTYTSILSYPDITRTPRKMEVYDKNLFILCRNQNDSAVFIIDENNKTKECNMGDLTVVNISPISPTSFIFIAHRNRMLVLGKCNISDDNLGKPMILREFRLLKSPSDFLRVIDGKAYVQNDELLYVVDLEGQNVERHIISRYPKCRITDIIHTKQLIYLATDKASVQAYSIAKNPLNNLVCVDTDPKKITCMKLMDEYTIIVGDRFGSLTVLTLPDDLKFESCHWRKSTVPDLVIPNEYRGKRVGRFIRLAAFSTYEMITSILISQTTSSIYYTTIHGSIGALVSLQDTEEFYKLVSVENQTEKACAETTGFMLQNVTETNRFCVCNADVLNMLGKLSKEAKAHIERGLKTSHEYILSILCKVKADAKF